MKVRQIVQAGWQNHKDFISHLKIRKKLNEYASKNDITKLYSIVHENYDPVFVLSTGRCGTAFLTNLMQANKNILALHEPEPEFFYHTQSAYNEYKTNPDKISAMFDVARYEMIRNSYIDEKKYIETNNRVTFFANQIASLYPKAKFIHLVRNPSSFIKSGLSRNWYSGNTLYDEGRIQSNSSEWKSFSQIEKIGWLWNETNSFIEDFKKSVSSDRLLTVKSEELFKSPEVQSSVLQFICGKPVSAAQIKKYGQSKINEGGKIELSEEQMEKIKTVAEQYPLKKAYNY